VVRNLRYTVKIDSVLANSKTQIASLFPVHAMFRHDCRLAVKPASTPRRLVLKKTWRDSLPIDTLPFGVTIPATVLHRSEILEGLMNFPLYELINLYRLWILALETYHEANRFYANQKVYYYII
jgi:hypothetical protein